MGVNIISNMMKIIVVGISFEESYKKFMNYSVRKIIVSKLKKVNVECLDIVKVIGYWSV